MVNLRALLSVVVLLFGVATSGAADDTQAVLKKAIEAHGGEKLLTRYPAGTSKVSGEIVTELGKTDFTGKLSYMLPNQYRITLILFISGAQITIVQTVNGDAARITVNDRKQPLTEDQKQETIASAALQEIGQLTPLLDKNRFTITSGKPASVAGQSTHVLIIQDKAAGTVKMNFDAKTGLLVQTTRQSLAPSGKKVEETTVMSDYKKVQGIMTPTKLVVTHDGQPFMTMNMSEIQYVEKLDKAIFTIAD